MLNGKKVSRKDFLKYLFGALFSFLCIFKLPSLSYGNNNNSKDVDANSIEY